MDLQRLSKVVSHALRHEPWLYELELDSEGWVCIEQLLEALREQNPGWNNLDKSDLQRMILMSDKKRHEISGDLIRAIYGHSTPGKIAYNRTDPPDILFHGTAPEFLERIFKEGLLPMRRQYVHMSALQSDAVLVGKRKSPAPVILRVFSGKANASGFSFYKGNNNVWLTNSLPPDFLEKI